MTAVLPWYITVYDAGIDLSTVLIGIVIGLCCYFGWNASNVDKDEAEEYIKNALEENGIKIEENTDYYDFKRSEEIHYEHKK